jgi:O-antigen ligase
MSFFATEPLLSSLQSSQVKNAGIVAIVIIVVIGLVIARLVTKVVTRVVVLVVAVVLAFAVYNQREHVKDAASSAAKNCDVTFFGVHVTPSDPAVKRECQKIGQEKVGNK